MSSVPWNKVYKLEGVAILSTPLILTRITKEQQDQSGIRRWTLITINERNKTKVTIISAYRVYIITIRNAGPNTTF